MFAWRYLRGCDERVIGSYAKRSRELLQACKGLVVGGIIGPLSSRESEVLLQLHGVVSVVRDRRAGGTPTREKGRSVP
jgi:hypothetical protein